MKISEPTVTGFAAAVVRNKILAVAIVVILTTVTGAATWLFLPKLEYLPKGNRNLIIGYIVPPPGYNLKTVSDIAQDLEELHP